VLATVVERVDVAVYDVIRSLREGRFEGGANAVYGLTSGGVELGDVDEIVPKNERDRLAAVARRIRSGEIAVPSAQG
jgi:basic membrane protein A